MPLLPKGTHHEETCVCPVIAKHPRMGGVDVEVHMGSHVNKLLSFVRTLFALSAIAGDLPNVYLTGDLAEGKYF